MSPTRRRGGLQKQVVTAQLVAGVDTSKDPKVTQDGLLLLENARVERKVEIRKRFGSAALTGSPAEHHMSSFDDMPVLIDDGSLKRHNGATYKTGGFDSFASVALMDVGVERQEAVNLVVCGDVAESSSVRVVVFCDLAGTEQPATQHGTFHINSYSLANGKRLDSVTVDNVGLGTVSGYQGGVRVLWTGNRLLVIYADDSGVLHRREVHSTTGVIGTRVALNTGAAWCDPDFPIDVCELGDYTTMIVMVAETGADLRVVTLSSGDSEYTSTVALTDCRVVGCYKQRTGIGVALYADWGATPDTLYMAGFTNQAVLYNAQDAIWTAAGTETVVMVTGARAASDTVGIVYFSTRDSGVDAGTHSWQTHMAECTVAAGSGACTAGASALLKMGCLLSSKPLWEAATANHFVILTQPDGWRDQVAYLTVRQDGTLYARSLHGYAQPQNAGLTFRCSRPHQISSTLWRVAQPHRSSGSETDLFGISVLSFDLDVTSLKCLETDKSLVIPAALPQEFDGRDVVEQGFSWYPPKILAAAGGGTGLTGLFGYRAVYEWTDAAGRRHRSGPSATSSVTLANQDCDIKVATLSCTAKSDVVIAIYRTEAAGAYYYRVGDVANDPTATSVSFIDDDLADTDLVAKEKLYSQAELENIQPGPFRVACIHQERLCYAHREWESTRLYQSKTFLPNTGVEYHEGLLLTVSPDGGRFTALESFRGNLVIFKKDRIFASYGQGYLATGGGSNYAAPELISEAIGCTDQKTIVRMPQGLAFMSRDGLYLLDSSWKVQQIGEQVSFWTDQYTYVSSALVADLHIAIWMSADSGAPALVFDYEHGTWTTWTNRRAHDCVVSYDGHLYWVGWDEDKVYAEDRDGFKDAGTTAVVLKIRTPWFVFSELLGHFRVYRIQLLGQLLDNCDLRVKTFFDYDPVIIDNQVFEVDTLGSHYDSSEHYGAGLAAGYTNKAGILQLGTSRQVLRAIMLEVTDESHDGGSTVVVASYTLNAIGFEIGSKPGLHRGDIGSARSF